MSRMPLSNADRCEGGRAVGYGAALVTKIALLSLCLALSFSTPAQAQKNDGPTIEMPDVSDDT